MNTLDSEELDRTLDRLDIGAFRIDSTGTVAWANDACARVLGLTSAKDVVGMAATDFYADPKERREIEARLLASESFRKTGVVRLDVRRLRRDTREPIPVALAVRATFDAEGRIAEMHGLIEEARENKLVESAFRASEERFRTMFDTSTVGMILTDVRGYIQRVNPAFCRLVGRGEDELLGIDCLSLIVPDERPDRPTPQAEPEGSAGRERGLSRADGAVVRAIVSWSWLFDEDGAAHSAVATVQDVTQQRLIEHGLQRLDKLESLGVLAGGIAHDFNNFLAVILANVSFAARLPDLGPRAREVLAQVEQAANRARELAQQLVTFAKGGAPVKRTSSVAALLNEAAGFYLRGSKVSVQLSLATDLWLSDLDPTQMSQVLQNLFINAMQAMPDGGVVHVDAENAELGSSSATPLPPGRYVHIRVRDEGTGIASLDLGRVFDPYFSTKAGGTGLGLATSHSIVMRHGGHLSVASVPGAGATFTLWLPASESKAVSGAPEADPRSPIPCKRVLVMDDEAPLRQAIASILGSCGLEVDTAADGKEAIRAYQAALESSRPYATVILDLTVPGGMGGIETLIRLRALAPDVRAIVSTGYSADPVMADCRAYGFAAALPKPFSMTELESVVREVLARRHLEP